MEIQFASALDFLDRIKQEREQCCKDVCHACAASDHYGTPNRETRPGGSMHWWHREIPCNAYAIRERAWQQEQVGK
jgi:hypothetical protein